MCAGPYAQVLMSPGRVFRAFTYSFMVRKLLFSKCIFALTIDI